MGFMSSIFGGGNDVKQKSTLTGGQKSLLDSLTEFLQGQIGKGVSAYPGQTYAGADPLQNQIYNMAGTNSEGIRNNIDAYNRMAKFGPSLSNQFLGMAQKDINNATAKFDPGTVMKNLKPAADLANRNFYNKTMPALMEKYGSMAGGNGAMNRAMAEASRDLSLGLSAQAQPYLFEGQQNQLNRQLQGAGMEGNLASIPTTLMNQYGSGAMDMLNNTYNIGASQRGMTQGGLDSAMQQWLYSQPYNNPWMKTYMGPALGTNAVENIAYPASPGMLQGFLNTAGGASLLGAGISNFAGSNYGKGLKSFFGY